MTQTIKVTVPFETDNQQYTLSDFLDVVFSQYEKQEDTLLTKIIRKSENSKNNTPVNVDEFLSSLD